MLDLFAQSSSPPFEVARRLHHDRTSSSSLCAFPISTKCRVPTALAKRNKVIPQPGNPEKPASCAAAKQQSLTADWRLKSDAFALNPGSACVTLILRFAFSKSQSFNSAKRGDSYLISQSYYGNWLILRMKIISHIVWNTVSEVIASWLWLLPALNIDLNPAEIMTLAFKRIFKDFWNEILKSKSLASISSELNCWTEYYIELLKNISILVKIWPLGYFPWRLEKEG